MVQYASITPRYFATWPSLVAILKKDISVTDSSGDDRPSSVSQGISQSRIRADLLGSLLRRVNSIKTGSLAANELCDADMDKVTSRLRWTPLLPLLLANGLAAQAGSVASSTSAQDR
jgi:hypothetical protein